MSVQAGMWNFDGKPVEPMLMAEFQSFLTQQGPDGESCWSDGPVALVYRPFHTTLESRREQQPHVSLRGSVLTWDGRLDNREELITELSADVDAGISDVAIVGAAFDRWGIGCFSRIIGDWAVTVWQPWNHELVLAADFMAVRHIFYYLSPHRIWWATDISLLVCLSHHKFQIDDEYIAGYFANEPDAQLTPYEEIRQVPPGKAVCIRRNGATTTRFWYFEPRSRIRYKTDGEYEEHFRHLFRQSVRRRLRSDAPILAELSGGLDSSSIVCVADEVIADGAGRLPQLDTLSCYDRTEPNGDDLIYFPKVEEKRGRRGHHLDVSNYGIAGDLDPTFSFFPGNLFTARELESQRLAVLQAGGYRVVLSGVGGDEFMGGIPNPSAQIADLIMTLDLVEVFRQVTSWSLVKRQPWLQVLGRAIVDLLPLFLAQYFVREARVEPWINKRFARKTKLVVKRLGPSAPLGFWLPTRRSAVGGVFGMANKLAKFMPRPLTPEEVRYPFLDQSLIEFVLSIPSSQLLRPGERRSLMRRSLVGIVPPAVLARRTKQLVARAPIIVLSKHIERLRAVFDKPTSSRLGYVETCGVLDALDAATNGKALSLFGLLKALSLEVWIREGIRRGFIAAAIPVFEPDNALRLKTCA